MKKIQYRKFQKARLEDEIQEWLEKENIKYKSWNMFFRELKNRYENNNK